MTTIEDINFSQADLRLTTIEARGGWQLLDWRELWSFRELLYFLALRDIKIRYKQTVLGIGWAVAQPLATMIVFTFFLGRAAGMREGVSNYPLFVFAGMVGWAFFSNIVTSAANSVVANERLVTKIYFPRLLIPLSTVGVNLFDLVIATVMLAIFAIYNGILPQLQILLLPILIFLLAASAAGVGILLSALIVTQRDFKHILTFGMQLWMFATPCLYMSEDALSVTARQWLPLNPAYGLVKSFRDIWLHNQLDINAIVISSLVGLGFTFLGLVYFRRVERTFADNI